MSLDFSWTGSSFFTLSGSALSSSLSKMTKILLIFGKFLTHLRKLIGYGVQHDHGVVVTGGQGNGDGDVLTQVRNSFKYYFFQILLFAMMELCRLGLSSSQNPTPYRLGQWRCCTCWASTSSLWCWGSVAPDFILAWPGHKGSGEGEEETRMQLFGRSLSRSSCLSLDEDEEKQSFMSRSQGVLTLS